MHKPKPNQPLTANYLVPDKTNNGHAHPDIEMITVTSVTFTSLHDLIPAASTPPVTPATHTIKNPLVKQAALSYLHPMPASPAAGDGGVFGTLRNMVSSCEPCGCFTWLTRVVSGNQERVRGWIGDDEIKR